MAVDRTPEWNPPAGISKTPIFEIIGMYPKRKGDFRPHLFLHADETQLTALLRIVEAGVMCFTDGQRDVAAAALNQLHEALRILEDGC